MFSTADSFPPGVIAGRIEARVREMPEQYYWLHKRFKTRPPGEPYFYER